MTGVTKALMIAGFALFILGGSLVSLHVVMSYGQVEPIGVVGLTVQLLGGALIVGGLIRAAVGR